MHLTDLLNNVINGILSINQSNTLSINVRSIDINNYNITDLISADTIIFGCHTIMGGVSSEFKLFMEYLDGSWQNQVLKDKFAAGFTTGHSRFDKTGTLQELSMFSAMHSMVWISQGHIAENSEYNTLKINRLNMYLGLASEPNIDRDDREADNRTAYLFGRRIAKITCGV